MTPKTSQASHVLHWIAKSPVTRAHVPPSAVPVVPDLKLNWQSHTHRRPIQELMLWAAMEEGDIPCRSSLICTKEDAKRNWPGARTVFRKGIPAAAQGRALEGWGQSSQLWTQEGLRGQWLALVMERENWSLCSALGILGCPGQTASLGFLRSTPPCPYFKGLLQVLRGI